MGHYVKLYNKTVEIWEPAFFDGVDLVVCPNPLQADDLREKIPQSADVITISKFMKNELKNCPQDVPIVGKSDLMLKLGTEWKKYFTDVSPNVFFQAYKYLTELRSFTTDAELIVEILDEFDEKISKAIKVMWTYIDQSGLIDEHQSYSLVSEAYRNNEIRETPSRKMVFYGFSQLSACQVDLIKAMGLFHQVYIPFPVAVFEKSTGSDWIKWLSTTECYQNNQNKKSGKCRVVVFPKGRLGEAVNGFAKAPVNVFLMVKNPTIDQINEIPIRDLYFKSGLELFSAFVQEMIDNIKEKFFYKSDSTIDVETETVLDWLKSDLKKKVLDKDFRRIKSHSAIIREITNWMNLSDENSNITLFDLDLIKIVTGLGLPRNFFSPILNQQPKGEIRGLEGLGMLGRDMSAIVCATSGYGAIGGSGSKYGDKIINFLNAVGPVQRREFEYLLVKEQLIEVLSEKNRVLFLEQGLSECDPAWSDILNSFENVEWSEYKVVDRSFVRSDYLGEKIVKKVNPLKTISATKIQTYIDCPRQYFFKYIDPISVMPESKNTIGTPMLGVAEHTVIEQYLTDNKLWNEKTHNMFVKKHLDGLIERNNLSIELVDYERYFVEIRDYSKNGIQTLLEIRKIDSDLKFEFETKISNKEDLQAIGSIDCVVRTRDMVGILDFKRSAGGIPSKKDIMSFVKIQMWFYLLRTESLLPENRFFGFLNLSEPTDSIFFTDSGSFADKMLEMNFSNGAGMEMLKLSMSDLLKEYFEMESHVVKKIKTEVDYNSEPRSAAVCIFCPVANICSRKIN